MILGILHLLMSGRVWRMLAESLVLKIRGTVSLVLRTLETVALVMMTSRTVAPSELAPKVVVAAVMPVPLRALVTSPDPVAWNYRWYVGSARSRLQAAHIC